MADKHTLNYEVRELKLGASFTDKKASQYHTIKYDFKPASVDVNKMATVDVGTNNQVTVTVPHLDGAGVPQTVFKGSQRPYTKECVLIIDRATGEITLEKLSSNIQVKKTRQENLSKPRPLTPVSSDLLQNTTQRSSSRTRVATNRRGPPVPHNAGVPGVGQPNGAARFNGAGAGGAKAPQNMVRSPPRVKTSPPQAAPWSGGGNSTLASLPMIGLDDALGLAPPPAPYQAPSRPERIDRAPERVDRAPERIERALDRVDRAPERIERALDRVDRAPERIERALDRMDRAPERIERALDRADKAPERVDRAPERADRAPERVPERAPERSYAPERQFNSHPPPAAQPPPASQDDSSSSSSSDSGSSSGSDSDSEPEHRLPHAHTNGVVANTSLPSDVLNDDLCLSESGSDSD